MADDTSLRTAIRQAAAREGVGIEQFRRQKNIPNAFFYALLRGDHPVPDPTRKALARLKRAGVEHPILRFI